MEGLPATNRLVDEGSIDTGGGAMKAKVLSVGLVTALVAAGLLAAVAMAWPQAQARSPQQQQQRQQSQPARAPQPAQLPVGGPTESALNYAD